MIGKGATRMFLRLLVCVALCTAFFAYGFATQRYRVFPYSLMLKVWQSAGEMVGSSQEERPSGRWNTVGGQTQNAEARAQLESLPYLSGYRASSDQRGITIYQKGQTFDGWNLYVSGHDTAALLMDMEGRVEHQWRLAPVKEWQTGGPPDDSAFVLESLGFWRRAHLFKNGDLLAIYEGAGIVKIDIRSRLLWSYWQGCHHDVDVDDQGNILVLTRKWNKAPGISGDIVVDALTYLSHQGEVLKSFSVLEAFRRSAYASHVYLKGHAGDIFHTNSVEILDGRYAERLKAMKKGNVLISIPKLDLIAIVDPEIEQVVWVFSGLFRRQHHPTVLDQGNILIFNNRLANKRSQVLEVDPISQEVVWEYSRDLFTDFLGSAYRLPNGNTLITESETGRAIEVTSEKEIVWEFISPHRAGNDNELVATLCDLIRLEPDYLEVRSRVW